MLKFLCVAALALSVSVIHAQSEITGKWKTIDDETGIAESIVEIFERDEKLYGRVIEFLVEPKRPNPTCQNCRGEDKNRPIMGLEIIKGLEKDDDTFNGKILNPKNGKVYKCYVKLEGEDVLKLRGYIGFSLLGKTQYWQRAN